MSAIHNGSPAGSSASLNTFASLRATILTVGCLTGVLSLPNPACSEGTFEAEFIFDPALESHGHVHASCIIECPNGDLRAVWYENGTRLPSPYFHNEGCG
jgi:hypothetical protein